MNMRQCQKNAEKWGSGKEKTAPSGMGASITKTVIENDIELIEGQYPSSLANLMSDAYTQIHKDGVAPMGMRTAIISLLYMQIQRRTI